MEFRAGNRINRYAGIEQQAWFRKCVPDSGMVIDRGFRWNYNYDDYLQVFVKIPLYRGDA